MLNRYLTAILVFASVLGSAAHATTVLNLGGAACHNLRQCEIAMDGGELNGAKAYLAGPQVAFGRQDFFGFSGGLILGSGAFPHAFTVSFDRKVAWLGGSMELASGLDGLWISGQNMDLTRIMRSGRPGTFTLDEPIMFEADTEYVVRGDFGPDLSLAIIRELSFAAVSDNPDPSPVPLPAPGVLLLLALAGLGWIGTRRRAVA